MPYTCADGTLGVFDRNTPICLMSTGFLLQSACVMRTLRSMNVRRVDNMNHIAPTPSKQRALPCLLAVASGRRYHRGATRPPNCQYLPSLVSQLPSDPGRVFQIATAPTPTKEGPSSSVAHGKETIGAASSSFSGGRLTTAPTPFWLFITFSSEGRIRPRTSPAFWEQTAGEISRDFSPGHYDGRQGGCPPNGLHRSLTTITPASKDAARMRGRAAGFCQSRCMTCSFIHAKAVRVGHLALGVRADTNAR